MRRPLWAIWPFVLLSRVSEALPHVQAPSGPRAFPSTAYIPSEWAGGACPHSNNTITQTNNGKLFQIECGLDHYGGDATDPLFLSTLGLCLELCADTPGCKAVSYRPRGLEKAPCYTKKEVMPGTVAPDIIGAKLVDPAELVSSAVSSAVGTTGLRGVPSSSEVSMLVTGTSPDRTPSPKVKTDSSSQPPKSDNPPFPIPNRNSSNVAPTGAHSSGLWVVYNASSTVTTSVPVNPVYPSNFTAYRSGNLFTPAPTSTPSVRNNTNAWQPATMILKAGVGTISLAAKTTPMIPASTTDKSNTMVVLNQHGPNFNNNTRFPAPKVVSWTNTTIAVVSTAAPNPSSAASFSNSTGTIIDNRITLLNISSVYIPRPTGFNGTRFNPRPLYTNGTSGHMYLPTPSNPNGFRPANTAPTGTRFHFPTAATRFAPTPTETHNIPNVLPDAPFPNGTVPSNPYMRTGSLVTFTPTALNSSFHTLTTPAVGAAGTGDLLPTGVSHPSPGSSPPTVGRLSTVISYTRTAIDNTVITVTDNTQASPTNGLTVTTFTAPDGAEKTLTFSAEVPRTSVHATGENSRSDTVSSIKSTDIQIPPDPITNTTVLRGSPAKRTYVPTPPTSAGSRQLIPSAPPYQTERYDTTVYVTPTTGLSPTPTPSNASCSPDTKEVEIEILWKIFKLLQENREENLKNPTPCSQNLSHILPDLLHQLRKTQDTI